MVLDKVHPKPAKNSQACDIDSGEEGDIGVWRDLWQEEAQFPLNEDNDACSVYGI